MQVNGCLISTWMRLCRLGSHIGCVCLLALCSLLSLLSVSVRSSYLRSSSFVVVTFPWLTSPQLACSVVFVPQSPPWSYGGELNACSPYLYLSMCHRWSSPASGNCTLWQHAARLFHEMPPDLTSGIGNATRKAEAAAEAEVSSELSEGCRDDLRKLARRWRQLVRNDPTAMLGPAGKALSPPELLLWLQAYGHAAPTVPAEGDSGTDPPAHPRTPTHRRVFVHVWPALRDCHSSSVLPSPG